MRAEAVPCCRWPGVPAPRAAIFLTVQPIAGALLGVAVPGDRFSEFTVIGRSLIVGGPLVTARRDE